MSLAGLLNESMVLYRKTASATYPYTPTWALNSTIPCYVSHKTLTTVSDDGRMFYFQETRFRSEPYSWTKGDRIYWNSHIYETMSYENFDELGMEAVTICRIMDDSVIADMGIS